MSTYTDDATTSKMLQDLVDSTVDDSFVGLPSLPPIERRDTVGFTQTCPPTPIHSPQSSKKTPSAPSRKKRGYSGSLDKIEEVVRNLQLDFDKDIERLGRVLEMTDKHMLRTVAAAVDIAKEIRYGEDNLDLEKLCE